MLGSRHFDLVYIVSDQTIIDYTIIICVKTFYIGFNDCIPEGLAVPALLAPL